MTSRLFQIVSSGIALANAHTVWFCIVPPPPGSSTLTVYAGNYHGSISGGIIIAGGTPGSEQFGPICDLPYDIGSGSLVCGSRYNFDGSMYTFAEMLAESPSVNCEPLGDAADTYAVDDTSLVYGKMNFDVDACTSGVVYGLVTTQDSIIETPWDNAWALVECVNGNLGSNTISVCLSDMLGDGWDDEVGLTITTDGMTETFTHDCDCACYDVPSKSGDYEISMLESGKGESHPWEVLWQVKGLNGAEYLGTIGSTLAITNHNDEVSSKNLIDVNAKGDSCSKPKPGPRSLLDSAEDTLLSAVKIDLQDAGNAGWCSDDTSSSANMCSNFPAKLTHPRFTVTEAKPVPKTKPATIAEGFSMGVSDVMLPSDGDFVFRAIGHDLGTEGDAQWEFCGQSGRLGHEMPFQMRDGVCHAPKVHNERTDDCSFEMTVLESIVHLGSTVALKSGYMTREEEEAARETQTFQFEALTSGVVLLTVAVGIAFTVRRKVKDGAFKALDTTEHAADVEMELSHRGPTVPVALESLPTSNKFGVHL